MSPTHAPTPCLEAGCYELASKAGRCARCNLLHDGMKGPPDRAAYDKGRGSARERGYDARWEKRRRRHLEIEPTCRLCGDGRMGNQVDHVIPHRGAPWLFDLKGGLQTLCESHHAHKTAAERSIPIGIIYPLGLPPPLRRTRLICGPSLERHVREEGPGTTVIYGDEADKGLRNRALAYGLRHRGAEGPLILAIGAPRTAERAFWAHVMGCEAELVATLYEEGAPEAWWGPHMIDHLAEEGMKARGGLTEREYKAETQGTFKPEGEAT